MSSPIYFFLQVKTFYIAIYIDVSVARKQAGLWLDTPAPRAQSLVFMSRRTA